MPITNKKLLSYAPEWARFPGFSVLFDNPGNHFELEGALLRLACKPEQDPQLSLYQALAQILKEQNKNGLCPLPPASYHVTAYDGGNAANVDRTVSEFQRKLEDLLESLPSGWSEDHELVQPVVESHLLKNEWAPICFQFNSLIIWGNQVLVATLAPADSNSQHALEFFTKQREELSTLYLSKFGIGAGPKFTPHISLAYFGTEEGGEKAQTQIDAWNSRALDACEGHTICFESAHIYAFTDMATFLRSK